MTSRERVITSLEHRQPDKIPVDFGGGPVTGMHVNIVDGLRRHYQLEDRLVKAFEPYQMLGLIETDLQDVLGLDVIGVAPPKTKFGFKNENWKEWEMDDGLKLAVAEGFRVKKNDNGSTLIFPQGDTSAPPSGIMPKDGYFFDSIIRQEKPVDDNQLNVQDNLEDFSHLPDDALSYFETEIKKAHATGRAVMVNMGGTSFGDVAFVPGMALKHPRGIRDITEWYMSTVIRPDYIHQIFEKQCEIGLQNFEKLNRVAGEHIDIVFICGTDFGTQDSQFCDEETFKSLYMPYYKKINEWIHTHTKWRTFKHSCGSIRNLIPAIIECGFDILNPVQTSAANMDPSGLKKEFGKDITFWGGGADTQHELMFGNPGNIRRQVFERCEIFGKDGGFVFNAIHNIQANTPLENVIAMIEAVHESNGD